mmetsp:Transcript_8744/g.36914  ORF Transcript_8744/g.36914 Transcript_8744/m.36914 type:complete len:364 (-) Transcript_8744:68-1159(-)
MRTRLTKRTPSVTRRTTAATPTAGTASGATRPTPTFGSTTVIRDRWAGTTSARTRGRSCASVLRRTAARRWWWRRGTTSTTIPKRRWTGRAPSLRARSRSRNENRRTLITRSRPEETRSATWTNSGWTLNRASRRRAGARQKTRCLWWPRREAPRRTPAPARPSPTPTSRPRPRPTLLRRWTRRKRRSSRGLLTPWRRPPARSRRCASRRREARGRRRKSKKGRRRKRSRGDKKRRLFRGSIPPSRRRITSPSPTPTGTRSTRSTRSRRTRNSNLTTPWRSRTRPRGTRRCPRLPRKQSRATCRPYTNASPSGKNVSTTTTSTTWNRGVSTTTRTSRTRRNLRRSLRTRTRTPKMKEGREGSQ